MVFTMGCDIHVVLEKQYKTGDSIEWVGLNCFAPIVPLSVGSFRKTNETTYWCITDRNYELFSALAGVRGNGPEPRGLPEDASLLTLMKLEPWGQDAHSISWGTLDDIGGLFLAHYAPEFSLEGHRKDVLLSLFGVLSYPDNVDLSEYRVVYWFDN